MAAVFWVVLQGVRTERARAVLFAGAAALGVVAVGMAAYQQLGDPGWLMMGRRQAPQFLGRSSGPFGIPNSLAAFMNLLLPAMVAMVFCRGAGARQRVVCGYLAVVFACGLVLTMSRGGWLSLGVALAAWPLLALRGAARRWRWSIGVVLVLAGALGALYLNAPRARERIDQLLRNKGEVTRAVMWRAGWKLAQERPLLGTGAGSYDVLFERYRPPGFRDDPQWAHNDWLNTLSDYGAVGFLLSFGMAGLLVSAMGRRPFQEAAAAQGRAGGGGMEPALRSGLAVGLLAFALQMLVDFNLKIPALAQAAAIAAALVAAPSGARPPGRWERGVRVPWMTGAVMAALLAVAIPWWVVPVYRAEALRCAAREQLDRANRLPQGGAARCRCFWRRGTAWPGLCGSTRTMDRRGRILPKHGLRKRGLTPGDRRRWGGRPGPRPRRRSHARARCPGSGCGARAPSTCRTGGATRGPISPKPSRLRPGGPTFGMRMPGISACTIRRAPGRR